MGDVSVALTSFQRLEEGCQHSFDAADLFLKHLMDILVEVSEVACQQQMALHFTSGSHRHLDESGKVDIAASSAAFGQICLDGAAASAELAGQPKSFVCGKLASSLVYAKSKLMGDLPHLKVAEILHRTRA